MIKISKKADYAVLVMASLAHRQLAHVRAGEGSGDGADPMGPVSAQEIADEVSLSRPLVANILKALTRAELLDSVRGVSGGYRLAQPLESISLAQIITALEGPLRIVDCAHDQPGAADSNPDCSISHHCPSRTAMQVVHSRIAALMEDIHLPELLRLSAAPGCNSTATFLQS